MEKWTVVEDKSVWDRESRTWTVQTRILAQSISRYEVDRHLLGNPNASAYPETR